MFLTLEAALEKARQKSILLQQVHYVLPIEHGEGEGHHGFGVETAARYDAVFVVEPGRSTCRVIDRRNRDHLSRAVA